ncbi:hypothetical protein DFH09DRAFT_1197249 [Mycena vulgaris]|nr:hypothetical protein DFH09DRAFT_1197249 [Mycena vulgaris]
MSTPYTDWNAPPSYEEDRNTSIRRGEEPPSRVKSKAPPSLEPRYVYYRVYGLDGPIRPKGEYGGSHPFIGRIKATSVPPPHTVASLKRALVQAEDLPDPNGELSGLFQSNEARTAMSAAMRVAILTGDIGATPETAFALVFLAELVNVNVYVSSEDEIAAGQIPQWLYYRLYTRGGEDRSARSFDSEEPGLGRIEREHIAPPRNVQSVKRRIAKVEGKPIYVLAELFTDVSADRAQASDAFVADTCGATQHDPILIVQPERRVGLHNRPLLVLAVPPQMQRYYYQRPAPVAWLSPSPGDIVHTDGIKGIANDEMGWPVHAYTAVDKSGRIGSVWAGKSSFSTVPSLVSSRNPRRLQVYQTSR